jgi:pimeloyl-ACP methyl ester carboxylesterase
MRKLYPLILGLFGLSLAGCFSDSGDPGPDPATGSTGIEEVIGVTPGDVPTGFYAAFDPERLQMPYPNDILGFLLFPPTDGTLNLPDVPFQLAASSDFGAPVNQLDGFSVFSRIQANFSGAVNPASLNAGTVFLLEVALDPSTRGVIGLSDETLCKLALAPQVACPEEIFGTGNPFLIPGVDYELSVAPDIDSGGQTIQLDPLQALNPFTPQQFTEGAINGYLMIITNGVTDTSGAPAASDATYEQIKQGYLAGLIQLPPPGTELPPDLPADQLLGLFIAAHLAVVEALADAGAPLSVENVAVTASFSPQDTTTVMQTVAALDILEDRPSQIAQAVVPVDVPLPGGGVLPGGTPVTTGLLKTLLGLPPEAISDNGDVYFGGLNVPYFLETPSEESGGYNVLTGHWVAEAGKNVLGDPDSTVISRWNPVPVKRADLTIPMAISIPNDNSAWVQFAKSQGLPVPLPTGWPVVIYQPGVTRFRGDQPLVAEPWLDQGYAVISIDLPGHGVTASDPTETAYGELFRVPGTTERTFDLDLRNNVDLADFTPDGLIDPRFVNFATPSPDAFLQLRDVIREAAAGLLALRQSIDVMDIDGNPANTDFDASQVHYVGHSGGGILGGIALALCGDCASISMPSGGAGWVKLLEESDREDGFGFLLTALEAGLAESGIFPNTTVYNNLLRDWQHVWNEGDPIGYVHIARESPIPTFGTLVNTDVAVTPAASLRLFEGLRLPQITTPGVNLTSRGYTRILDGEHSSFISPAANPTATIEMQTEVALFIGGNPLAGIPPNGQAIVISNPDIVETE